MAKKTKEQTKLIAAAKIMNKEMGLDGDDVIDIKGTVKELKAGIKNAAKYVEDTDDFGDVVWDVLEELDLVMRPNPVEDEAEEEESLELAVGCTVSVDFDGEDYNGVVTKINKRAKKATIEFEDGDTDDIPVDDITVLAAPEAEEEEEVEEAPKKKRSSRKKKEEPEEEPEDESEEEDILEVGSRVSVDFDGEAYEGEVTKIARKKVSIIFDDGDTDTVPEADVTLLPAKKKAKVKKDKAKAKPAAKRAKKEPGAPSNKERIYKKWKAGTKDPEKLHNFVDGAVQLSTIKSWTRGWAEGKRLPACAK